MRLIPCSVLLAVAVVLLALPEPGRPAPAPKDAPGPVTAEQLKESAENLKQIVLAIHNHNDTCGTLPTNVLSNANTPLLSWRVQILPYIGHGELYQLWKQFKLDEAWDSDHNKKLIDKMPKVYAPIRVKADAGKTFYQAFGGSNGWLKAGARIPASFPDGTSNTFLIAEAAKPVVWTKPDDLTFDGKDVPALGGLFDGRFHAAMADGSVQRFRKGIDPAVLRLLIDPADGNPLPDDRGIDPDERK